MAHYNPTRLLNRLLVALGILSGIVVSSCNAKEDTPQTDDYLASESVAVTGFSLTADARVMRNLDSVFFSIDLDHGVIFNADSLPKGTNVTKLIPKISYPSSVSSAVITMTGGSHREGEVDYKSNATDTIDFTGSVTLKLSTSGNSPISKTYTLKVNVHQQDPDTIYWDRMASMDLPSRMENPLAQKSLALEKGVVCLIRESDGSYTLSTTSDLFEGQWRKQAVNFSFVPRLETLTLSKENSFYILDEEGVLLMSDDCVEWTQATSGWNEIIGMYGNTLLGISQDNGIPSLTGYPEGTIPSMELPSDFPLSGFSAPIEFSNRWTPDPTIVIFGGYPYSSTGKSPSWAFDGSRWMNIAENALPALSGLSIMKYYSYLKSASSSLLKEFEVYLAFGGRGADGTINNTIYVSYDNGINWQKAQGYMQLPPEIQVGYMPDALAVNTTLESDLSSRWKVSSKRRIPFEVNGDIISWECPYIFIFGGYDKDQKLYSRIRGGVLQRLTFAPLF